MIFGIIIAIINDKKYTIKDITNIKPLSNMICGLASSLTKEPIINAGRKV